MFKLDNAPGRLVFSNNKEYLFFSGYSYLGMGQVPEFIELVKEGLDKFGLVHPSARISNTQLNIYEALEEKLSLLTGQEKTLSFSSGYLAGRAVAELFINDEDSFVLPNTHPVLKNTNNSFPGTIDELITTINNSNNNKCTIVCDSINPLNATITDLSFLSSISKQKTVTCIIDDSHGVGLIGEKGKGISAFLPQEINVDYMISYSLSKAFHVNGGAVSSNTKLNSSLLRSPFYTGSTPIAPAMAYAFTNGQHLYKQQQEKLNKNISCFIEMVRHIPSIAYHPQLPVFILPEQWDDVFFEQHNMIISSFSYPDPSGKKINRIVLNALHTEEDLERIASILINN